MATSDIPVIDRNIKNVGLSGLRKLDRKRLREFDDQMLVIHDHNTPLAVVLSYEKYLVIQDRLQAAMATNELLDNPDELKLLVAGIQDAGEGKTRNLSEIRRSLKSKKE